MGPSRSSEPAPAAAPRRLARLRDPTLAGLVAVTAYLNTLGNQANLDDGWAVVGNPLVRNLDLARIFREQIGFAAGPTLAGPYRPLATLTNAVNYALHGAAVGGYHAVNVALHALATLLVWALARRLLAALAVAWVRAGALGAALLFAVHPVHVEAVAPLVGRADLQAAAGGLGALLLALGWRERWWRLPVALLLLAAAVLSKETAAVLPGLFALVALAIPASAGLDAPPGLSTATGRGALGRLAGVTLLLALALLPYLLLRPGAAVANEASRWFAGRPPEVVFFTMTRGLAEYLRLLAWPVDLMTDFGYAARIPFAVRFGSIEALATLTWGAVLVAGVACLRRAPLAAIGLLWSFVALTPVLNVLPVGVLMAERFLYLGSVGFCLWVGGWPSALAARAARAGGDWPARARWLPAAGLAVLALLVVRTGLRNAEWHDPVSLYTAELRHAPRDVTVNNNLAVAYLGRGEPALAAERLAVALEVAPGYWRAHVNLGIARQRQGDLAGARRAFAAASAIAPGEGNPRYFDALVLRELGEREAALVELARAAALDRFDPRIPLEQGRLLLELGRREAARAPLQRALALDPRLGAARVLQEGLP